jgi:phosphatidylglycerophosphate synthase
MVFAGMAGAALAATACPAMGWRILWLLVASGIQLRLACNLLDGMVAVEGGRKSPAGVLWNEVPDRFSDAAILVGAGYAAGSIPVLGWAAAVLAILTAYVRAMGAAAGCGEHFEGIMSKPKRMAALTIAAIGAFAYPSLPWMILALSIVAAGSLVTCLQRLWNIASQLRHV